MTASPARTVIIGIGNTFRGDDAAGRHVAAWLSGRLPPGPEIVESDGEPATLIDHLERADIAILVDACRSGAAPGVIHRLDVSRGPLPGHVTTLSTHGVGVADVVELTRALDRLPRRCVVFGIEAASFDFNSPMTEAVAAAVPEAGRRVLAEVTGGAAHEDTDLASRQTDARPASVRADQRPARGCEEHR